MNRETGVERYEPWQANAYMAGQRYVTQSLDQGQQAPRPVREVLVTEREARLVNGELIITEREVYIVEGDSNQSWPTQALVPAQPASWIDRLINRIIG